MIFQNNLEIGKLIENTLNRNKANNIVIIDLKQKSYIADYMIIASGTSSRHLQSLSENIILELFLIRIKIKNSIQEISCSELIPKK